MRQAHHLSHPLCSSLVLLAVVHGAQAQTPAPPGELSAVTVTAGQLEQKSFDAPASVSVVEGAAIRASGPQVNLSDALAGMPGVVALNRNNYAQDVQISIRGFGARAAFGLQGIRLIADGIPATIPDGQGQASTVSLTSAGRVEVLRGPLAQLYGNASGGVIQTFTREAGSVPEAQVQAFTGSYGLRRTDLQASGRSSNGLVGIVADLSNFEIGGWRDNASATRRQFNTVITADPQPGTRMRFIANVFDMPTAKDPLGLTAAQLARNPQQAGTNAALDATRKAVIQHQLGWVVEQNLPGDLQLQGRLYYGTRDNMQYQAGSATTSPANANGTWVGLTRNYGGVGLQLKGKQRGGEVPMDWVVGYQADRSSEIRQGGATLLGNQTGQPTRNEQNVARNSDWFGQTNWFLGERWTLVAGARLSQVTLANQDHFLIDGNDSGSVTYRAVSPVLGLTWSVSDNLNLYANTGKGFETPTLSAVAYVANGGVVVNQFNPNLKAATSVHNEMGLKWRLGAHQLLEAALFQITTSNEIVTSLSSAGKSTFVNAPSTERQGLELNWQTRLNPHWAMQWSGTLMRARYTAAFTSAGTSVSNGNLLPAVPQQQVLARLSWTQQSQSDLQPTKLQGAQATLEWVARSQLYANDANSAGAPGQGLFNLRLREGMQLGAWNLEAYAGINNLANRSNIGSVITNQAASQYFEPGLPRNWVLGLRASLPL